MLSLVLSVTLSFSLFMSHTLLIKNTFKSTKIILNQTRVLLYNG
uniref:Uncharacterized protein n=1 Tax=Geladintestivirus 6 TaxID=3233138 RepID=A0AAU8MI34_9CAUD